jgi:hypothetical protein
MHGESKLLHRQIANTLCHGARHKKVRKGRVCVYIYIKKQRDFKSIHKLMEYWTSVPLFQLCAKGS